MRLPNLIAGPIAALSLCGAAWAGPPSGPPDVPEIRTLANQFFVQIKAGDAVGAFQSAFKGSTSTPPTALQGVSGSIGAVVASFGGVIDWTPHAKEVVTPTLIRETYYVRTREQPVFFTINFYKPSAAWRITDVQFGTFYHMKDKGYLIDPD